MPEDPISNLAGVLIDSSQKSYPMFDHVDATRVYLTDDPKSISLKLNVFLTYQGRTELRHCHYHTYDADEVEEFQFDNPAEQTGLKQTCEIINNEINSLFKNMVLESQKETDQILVNWQN